MTNRINTLLYKNTCADENMFLLLVKNSKKLHICFSFSLKEKNIYKMLLNGNSKVDLWCSAKSDFESNHNLCKQNSSILYKTVSQQANTKRCFIATTTTTKLTTEKENTS